MYLNKTFSGGGATVTAYTQDRGSSKTFLGKAESRKFENGHTCVMVFCDKIVHLKATRGNEELSPAKHNLVPIYPILSTSNNTVKFESRMFGDAFGCQTPPCKGPMFPYAKRHECENAAKDKSFRFNFALFTKPPEMHYSVGSQNVYDKKLSWYPVSPEKSTFRSCFFKVLLKIYDTYDIRIIAISHFRNFSGEQFGTHIVGPTPNSLNQDLTIRGACLEFRCPGYVRDGATEVFDAPTAVEIHLSTANTSMKCQLKVQSAQLKTDITPINGKQGVTGLHFLSKAGVNYGSSFGVFINDDHKNDVERFCRSGLDTGPKINGAMNATKNPAVEFDCRS